MSFSYKPTMTTTNGHNTEKERERGGGMGDTARDNFLLTVSPVGLDGLHVAVADFEHVVEQAAGVERNLEIVKQNGNNFNL